MTERNAAASHISETPQQQPTYTIVSGRVVVAVSDTPDKDVYMFSLNGLLYSFDRDVVQQAVGFTRDDHDLMLRGALNATSKRFDLVFNFDIVGADVAVDTIVKRLREILYNPGNDMLLGYDS